MAILNWQIGTMGQVSGGIPQQQPPFPTFIYIATNDTNSTVTAAGYLNTLKNEGFSVSKYNMAVVYTTDDGCQIYQITVSNTGVITLVPDVSPGNVLLPVVAGHIATFTNTAGQIGDQTGTAINKGSIQAGLSGTAGQLTSFPPTAASGSLSLNARNSAGDFPIVISNASYGQSSTLLFADVGNANGRFLVAATTTPFTANHSMVASGTGGLIADAGYQMKVVAQAAVAGGAAAQTVNDAFCTSASMVVCTWNDTTNPASIQKAVAGNGSFIVTSSADPGASHLNYIITKV